MPIWAIIVCLVIAALLLLVFGGMLLTSRRMRETSAEFEQSLTSVDRQLASAVAEDHGWHPDTLDAAARAELASHRPGTEVTGLELVQIVDEPGTDQDLAIFSATTSAGALRLTLGRRDGDWYAKSVEDVR